MIQHTTLSNPRLYRRLLPNISSVYWSIMNTRGQYNDVSIGMSPLIHKGSSARDEESQKVVLTVHVYKFLIVFHHLAACWTSAAAS